MFQEPEMIKKQRLRDLMLLHRNFLAKLYQENKVQSRKTLVGASNGQLRLVVFVLNAIAVGSIPLKLAEEQYLINSGRAKLLHKHFFQAKSARQLLKSTKSEKLDVLCKFTGMYKTLFY